MPLSKKIRFEVFKRDRFVCAYCGSTPPKVVLEIDHIKPKSSGGNDDINNLTTACFDCNRGKRHTELDKIPFKLQENLEVLREQQDQIEEYYKFLSKNEQRIKKDIQEINTYYEECTGDKYTLSQKFKDGTLRNFLKYLNKYEIKHAMTLAFQKFPDDSENGREIKYFCGICWNWIKHPETKAKKYGETTGS